MEQPAALPIPRRMALEMEKNASNPEEAIHWLGIALEARSLGDDEAVYEAAKNVKREAPRSPVIREMLGAAAFELERWHEAAQELLAYRRLSGSRKRDSQIAECYRREGRASRALEFLSGMKRADVDADTWIRSQTVRARALADTGRPDVAISVLESLREPKVRPEVRDEARALLAELRGG